MVGPWVDEATELAGWDIERFLAIARDGGRAWRDAAVEYPPGSVIVFELLDRLSPSGAVGLVTAHRVLVLIALSADLAVAWLLHRRDRRAGLTYLLLGLPLVPMGLLRLDIVAALPAVAAVLLVTRPSPCPEPVNEPSRLTAAGALVAAGAMIKLWPALLIPALWSGRRERAAAAGIVAGALTTMWWLLWAGAGLDPIRQVVDLRGATGWQLESVGGVLTTLADAAGLRTLGPEEGVRLELNAFRIGTLIPWLVTVGRAVAVAAMAALAWRARRVASGPDLSVIASRDAGLCGRPRRHLSPAVAPVSPLADTVGGAPDGRRPPATRLTAARSGPAHRRCHGPDRSRTHDLRPSGSRRPGGGDDARRTQRAVDRPPGQLLAMARPERSAIRGVSDAPDHQRVVRIRTSNTCPRYRVPSLAVAFDMP